MPSQTSNGPQRSSASNIAGFSLLPNSGGLPPTPGNSEPKEEGALSRQGSSQGYKVLPVLSPKALWLPLTHLVSGL